MQHPAAKMIVMASYMQEQEVGDGTNFVLVFAGALLELAEELLRMGLSVSEVRSCWMSSCLWFKKLLVATCTPLNHDMFIFYLFIHFK